MVTKPKTEHEMAMDALRAAHTKMQDRMPGTPCVALDLSKVSIFNGENGELRAVVSVQEVIYIADGILRSAATGK